MFYGREDLLEQLGALLERPMATLVTCRGRRRIGKSTLIEEFARRTPVTTATRSDDRSGVP